MVPWIYPLFNPESKGHFGGWEVRMASIARSLARRDRFEVCVLTADHGQPHVERHEGITLYSWRGREIWGVPQQSAKPGRLASLLQRLRLFQPRNLPAGQIGSYVIRPEMLEIYDEIGADIYSVPGNSQFSGELAFYCQERGKPYVFLAGSDYDLYPEYGLEPTKADMYGVPYALKAYTIGAASVHVLQNARQLQMLEDGYGRSGTVVRNPIDLAPRFPRSPSPEGILWVGRSDERVKRPSLALELARRLPETPFTLILNQGVPETHASCLQEAATLPNVTLIERVPFDEVERFYASALLFVNTSGFEGFPNTFLQAAKYGVPIVASDVDPGGMLSEHGCGTTCGGEFEKFAESVKSLMTDQGAYAECSAAALRYVRAFHDENVVIAEYEKAFLSALEGKP
ncbi:MAG: glycosyltransferase family 4 protein [Thermoanaerobaculia bacterium]|nr:glycosyltransferase family 4 protein [Thermoanaerobaculia bacterium]